MSTTDTPPKQTEKRHPEKSQAILDEALRIFYENGFHATGVDRLMADAGISKRTLYKYFSSKEVLVEAVVAEYADRAGAAMFAAAKARSDDPREQILAVFDIRRDIYVSGGPQGCLAVRAGLEYFGKHAGIEAQSADAQVRLTASFAALAEQAGLPEPLAVGRQLTLLLQGAAVTSKSGGDLSGFDAAMPLVRRLVYA